MTTCKGIAKGRSIELAQPLPYSEGQLLQVTVEPVADARIFGAPQAILRALERPPHPGREDVAEMERLIEEGKLPVDSTGAFDAERE